MNLKAIIAEAKTAREMRLDYLNRRIASLVTERDKLNADMGVIVAEQQKADPAPVQLPDDGKVP